MFNLRGFSESSLNIRGRPLQPPHANIRSEAGPDGRPELSLRLHHRQQGGLLHQQVGLGGPHHLTQISGRDKDQYKENSRCVDSLLQALGGVSVVDISEGVLPSVGEQGGRVQRVGVQHGLDT